MNFLRQLYLNHPLANILFAVVILLGALSYVSMPREQDPEINFNWVNVITVLPGASASDVEKLVTKPLEDAIKTVADVRFVSSSSRESASSILIRFHDISARVFDKRVNDLRREIQNKANQELPKNIEDPQILEITTSNGFPTVQVLLAGQADDEALRFNARLIKDDLERLTGVDKVMASGLRDPELLVTFDPARLAGSGLAATDVADSVAAWFRDTFAGKLRAGEEQWLVRIVGQDADPEYVSRISLSPAGDARLTIPLSSVARAERTREEPRQLVSYLKRPAVFMAVSKKSYTNTIDLVERVDGYIAAKNKLLAASGLELVLIDDQTIPTRDAIGVMESNAVLGLALVLALCWVFLGAKVSVLVSLGVPFALAGTFAVLNAAGFTVNISVLLGAVIALGMLVDDAVVVAEAIYYRVERGQEAMAATLDGIKEVFAPVMSSVATTIAAFLPLMLLPGIVGKFMFVIPFVVTLALAISLIEAFWMMPAHVLASRLDLSQPSRMQRWRNRFNHKIRLRYAQALMYVMRRPKRFLGVGALLLTGAVLAVVLGAVRVQFFAFDPIRLFYVNVDMPAGVALEETLRNAEAAEERVRRHLKEGEARALISIAGIKFTDIEPLIGEAYGQVAVALHPRRDSMREVSEIVAAMRADVAATPGRGKITFLQISGGPPLTKPINVKVRGDEYAELRAAADAIKAIAVAIPGARDVADDDLAGRPEFTLKLDADALASAGLNAGQVARLIRLHVDGEIVAVTRDKGEKLEVRVRGPHAARSDVASLLDDPIVLPNGSRTTLGALVRPAAREGKGVIKHHNLRRAITVEADLDKTKTDTVQANNILKAGWEKVRARYPNVDLDFSGELDDIQESLDAMAVLFLLGLGLIYLILAAQFKSYFQPLLILVTVPLAFTGVTLGLLVSNHPLSLYTLYGVIALTGIAVNSAIVLMDAANERLKAGMSLVHASVYAARRRVVPIVITSSTTIAGLFSLAFGIGGKSLIWGPVAASIVWGLGFATLLTLFLIPLLYRLTMGKAAKRLQRLV